MDFEIARFNMVEQQIRPSNITNKKVIEAFTNVKRENFILAEYKKFAYADMEVPLPNLCKMFTPKMEAIIIQNLDIEKDNKILEIGTGSGYVTTIITQLAKFVYSFELDDGNVKFAVNNLTNAGVTNASIIHGDGFKGCYDYTPFDRILVSGALFAESEFDDLKSQLNIGGVLIGIVGRGKLHEVVKIVKIAENHYTQKKLFETCVEYLDCKTKTSKDKFIF